MAAVPKEDHRKALVTTAILLAIALVPRLHGLSSEYVDLVEFLTMTQPPHTPLLDYLWRLWDVGPDQVPAYYIFTWGVREIFGYSWLVTRVASLLLMLSVLLMAWRFASLRFGAWAGFLAGALLALSPADVYYAIQARSYSLVIFEAAVSIWAITRAVETGKKRWWFLNIATNTLLPWTHLFGFLLIAAEGLWLLGVWYVARPTGERFPLKAWETVKRGALWGAGHGLAIALALAWLLRETAGSVAWYAPAPWKQAFTDVLGDAMFFGNLFVYESTPGQPVFQFAASAIRNSTDYWLAYAADAAVVLVFLAALVSAAWSARAMDTGKRQTLALLFLCALLPPIFLYAAAALTIPVALPRYTAYCNFPLYILLGIGLAKLSSRRMGLVPVAAVFLAMGTLCATWDRVRPEVDWPGAVALVRQQPDSNAPVIALSFSQDAGVSTRHHRRMMEYTDDAGRDRYRHAYTIAGAVDACSVACARTQRPVCILTYSLPSAPEQEKKLMAMLRENGFRISVASHQYFKLYTVSNTAPAETWKQAPDETGQRYLALLGPYLKDIQETQERTNAALRWAIQDGDDLRSPRVLATATLALLEVSPILARASAQYEATLPGQENGSAFVSAMLALGDGDPEALRASAAQIQEQLGDADLRDVANALQAGDTERARAIVAERRFVQGVQFPPVLAQLLGLEERLPYATMGKGQS